MSVPSFMTEQRQERGPRFDLAELSPEDDARFRELWGRSPINLYRILAHQPRILRAWTEWNNELRHGCQLPRALREIIFLRSAVLEVSAYEWAQHVEMARRAGLSEEKVAALASSIPPKDMFDERELAILRATEEITRGRLSGEAFKRLRRCFSPAEILEVIVTASHTCMLARVVQAIGVTTAGEIGAAPFHGDLG